MRKSRFDLTLKIRFIGQVSVRQLRLFDHSKPLLLRFGADFFRSVPSTPGVYIMRGTGDRVLYIGQSTNLRSRLHTYKNANPDHTARKILRLVHQVEAIAWEECGSPEKARLRENELLRTHRPKFNTVNKYPKAHCFIRSQQVDQCLEFTLTREPVSGEGWYGAFKTGGVYGYQALLRLLWAAVHQTVTVHELPSMLSGSRVPKHFLIACGQSLPSQEQEQLSSCLQEFFEGKSPRITEWLQARLPAPEKMCHFDQTFQASNLETLANFFEFGPARNNRLRAEHQLGGRLIGQEELDDLIVAQTSKSTTATVSITGPAAAM